MSINADTFILLAHAEARDITIEVSNTSVGLDITIYEPRESCTWVGTIDQCELLAKTILDACQKKRAGQ